MKEFIKHIAYKLMGDSRREIIAKIKELQDYDRHEYARIEEQIHIHIDCSMRDIMIALSTFNIEGNSIYQGKRYELRTDYPVAYNSMDHLYPWGTKNDNTRAPFFIRKCETLFPDKKCLHFADLGCSGGGIVLDALLRGHEAIGLEGSDYSLLNQRAEWRLLRNNLFTCDIAKPFSVLNLDGTPACFDIVSAWEVLEHIPESEVSQLIDNISRMLAPGAYFVGTASQVEDCEPESGVELHVTVKPAGWWINRFEQAGLERADGIFENRDLARGPSGNPPHPWIINWMDRTSSVIVMRKSIVG